MCSIPVADGWSLSVAVFVDVDSVMDVESLDVETGDVVKLVGVEDAVESLVVVVMVEPVMVELSRVGLAEPELP